MNDYDLCVIGGGINGAGIARDAAGRGLSVLLVESDDLGSATSSASTKLIHGGLRYLEHYEFSLVRHALQEREVLMNLAPFMVRPMTFVLPHDKTLRPAWMIRAGLFLYDHLAGRKKLESSRQIDCAAHPYGTPLKAEYKKAFTYADCWVEDSRLVVLNAIDAQEKGATVLTRTECAKIRPAKDHWKITLKDIDRGKRLQVKAKTIINATGPWVRSFLEDNGLCHNDTPNIRLVRGSHIIVPRQFDGDQAYILQQPDRRIVFSIPYEEHYTMVGTTEAEQTEDPRKAVISDNEKNYLIEAFNRSFNKQITHDDIVSTFSGVRPLFDDGDDNASEVTRDYKLIMERSYGPTIISAFGGKLTTYRRLAEDAVDMVTEKEEHWTSGAPLPGGSFAEGGYDVFLQHMMRRYQFLSESLIKRYARAYGAKMQELIGEAEQASDLGIHFGDNVYEAEINYLMDKEWARTLDDVLWRRSKLGLHISKETLENLKNSGLLQ